MRLERHAVSFASISLAIALVMGCGGGGGSGTGGSSGSGGGGGGGSAPAAFGLASPTNGAPDALLTPTLSWTASAGATSYTIQVDTSAAFAAPVLDRSGVPADTTSLAVPAGTLAPGTTYLWRVVAVDAAGQTVASGAPFSFTTEALPGAFSLLAPAEGALDQPLAPTLTWQAASGATSYAVEVDTSAQFASPLVQLTTVDTSAAVPAAALAPGTTYRWRVVASDGVGSTVATAPFAFTTQALPAAFALATPPDGATAVALAPTLTWSASSGQQGYDLQISTSPSFAGPLVYEDATLPAGALQATVPAATLSPGTTYHWRVLATSAVGDTAAGNAPASFTTGAPPPAFALAAPADGAVDAPLHPTFAWTATAADALTLQIAADASFTAPLVYEDASLAGTTSVTVPDGTLAAGRSYAWRVVATNAFGSTAAGPWALTTAAAPPAAFALVSPAAGAAVDPQATAFQWTGAEGATSYRVEVGFDSTFATTLWSTTVSAGATQAALPPGLLGVGGYAWRVAAIDAFGETTAANAPWSFAVAEAWRPMAGAGAPSPRSGQAAAWTGRELVVWGGSGASGLVADGARYDPVTDAWQPTSGAGAPSARSGHAAVWTGREVIVWGGTGAGGPVTDGGRYDPATDSWTAVPGTGMDGMNATDLTAVWTGREMIVWGGRNASGQVLNVGARYDPRTNAWTGIYLDTNPPSAREDHVAVWTGREMIVWGGSGAGGDQTSGARYDPATNRFTPISTAGAPVGTSYGRAVWTGREMIVFGGLSGGYQQETAAARYDPSTDTWTALSTAGMPTGRYDHAAAWTGHDVVVWGGYAGPSAIASADGARYDPRNDTWTSMTLSGAASPRARASAAWTGRELLVWGGVAQDRTPLGDGGRYGVSTFGDAWAPIATPTAIGPLARHVAVWTGREMIVWGGGGSAGARYDPVTDGWVATSTVNAPTGRTGEGAVWTGREMIVVGGGYNGIADGQGGRYDPVNDSWTATAPGPSLSFAPVVWTGREVILATGPAGGRYDPTTDTWATMSTANAPVPAKGMSGVWTGRELVIWGGWTASSTSPPTFTSYQTGGRYDPVTDTWTPTTIAGAPAPRNGQAAVWDGREMIVWGGSSMTGQIFADGARYDPRADAWTPMTSAGAPPARSEYQAGFSALWTGDRLVVFGGYLSSIGAITDTGGEYDPVRDAWSPTPSAGVPQARHDHTAVWTGRETIIWGGVDSTGSVLGDGATLR